MHVLDFVLYLVETCLVVVVFCFCVRDSLLLLFDYSAEYGGEPVTVDEFCKLMKKEGRKPIKLWAVTKD